MKFLATSFFLLVIAFAASAAMPYTLFRENGKVGLKNEAGEVVIPAKYEGIGWSNGKFSVVENVTGCKSGNAWGLISLSNQQVTKHEFDELLPGESNILIARKKSPNSPRALIGAISSSGKEIIPFVYDGIIISSLRAIVFTKIGNQFKYGLINLENKTLIPQQYQDIRPIGTLRYAVRNFEGKIAIFTDAGRQISAFTIDSISSFHKDYAILYEGKHQGLINRNGEVRLPAKYREVKIDADDRIHFRQADQWYFLSGDNKRLRELRVDSVDVIENGLYKIATSGQVQLTDKDFNSIVQGVFDNIGSFSKGKAAYVLKDLTGVIQKDGTVVVPALYNEIQNVDNFFLAQGGNGNQRSWILFDSVGTRLTQKTYQQMRPLKSNFFAVGNRGYWGVVDASGREVVAIIYDSLIQFRDNLLVVKFKGLNGVIDLNERWVVTPRANKLTLVGANHYLEESPTSVNLKEIRGNVIYFTSNRVEAHDGYLLEYLPSGNIWKVDFNGVIVDRTMNPKEVTEMIYQESEGYRAVKRNGRYGFIDREGRLRIANRYEGVQPFREGFAAVKILGKWGFINLHDNITVQPVYDEVESFENKRALVRQKGMYGLIDPQGKLVLPVRYQSIEALPSGNLLIRIDNLYGLADASGKMLITARYDKLIDTGKGYVIAVKNDKYGVLSLEGINTVPMMYDFIKYDPHENVFLAMQKATWEVLDR